MASIGKVIQEAISSKTQAEINKAMKPILAELLTPTQNTLQ